MANDIQYAVVAHRASQGESGALGYDVMAIQGHDAQGTDVFLWLTPVGWSRTVEGVRSMIARRTATAEGSVQDTPKG